MHIQMHIDTEAATSQEAAILRALADAIMNEGASVSGTVIQMADRKAEQAPEPVKAPQPTRRTRKAAAAPEPEPEPAEEAQDADEDLLGEDGPTLDTAVDRATALVQEGKGPAVKKALDEVGAAKVRELTDEQIPEFLAALEDA